MKRAKVDLIAIFLNDVDLEASRAMLLHPPIHSLHEGYAVMLEEVDEVKAEVWKKSKSRDLPALRKELIQVAAMALRMAVDCRLPIGDTDEARD